MPKQSPLSIQTEIRVDALLKMYQNSATAYFLCYNVAVMLKHQMEKHPKWAEYLEENTSDREYLTNSGYLYYSFIEEFGNRSRFEKLIIQQFAAALTKVFPGRVSSIETHYDINYVGDMENLGRREIREAVLQKMLDADPNAVFVIET